MDYLETVRRQFNNRISFHEKKKGIYQLFAPFYHEDGDMYDIFVEASPGSDNKVRVCDHGLTMMKLSYVFDIDTQNKEKIFQRIILENGLSDDNGNLYIDAEVGFLYNSIMSFSLAISKITNMQLYKRELIQSHFYEQLMEFVDKELGKYQPVRAYLPIPDREDLEVDYSFPSKNKNIYLFAVKDSPKARLVSISCLEYLRKNISFRSVAVHEDFEKLSKKDRKIITNVVDKQYTDLEDFRQDATKYFDREIA
jgi:hypothetical protein